MSDDEALMSTFFIENIDCERALSFQQKRFRRSRILENLKTRQVVRLAIREFFISRGYLEVDTPIRIPAPAPEEHIDCPESEGVFLQASPELAMKELLASGFPKIFQMARCFRKGERGGRHLPEFDLLEWYQAEKDYRFMMEETQALVRFVAKRAGGLSRSGRRIDCEAPFERLTVEDAFSRYASIPMEEALSEGRFDEILALEVEPHLGFPSPTFLMDYPKSEASLARLKKDDPSVAERFELYVDGLELCNAFSELVDVAEQKDRFEASMAFRKRAGKVVYPEATTFLEALSSMPEATGNALGVDRLVMLACGADSIDEVTAILPEEL